MICKKCGIDNKDGSVFCNSCGARLSLPEPKPEPEIRVEEHTKYEIVKEKSPWSWIWAIAFIIMTCIAVPALDKNDTLESENSSLRKENADSNHYGTYYEITNIRNWGYAQNEDSGKTLNSSTTDSEGKITLSHIGLQWLYFDAKLHTVSQKSNYVNKDLYFRIYKPDGSLYTTSENKDDSGARSVTTDSQGNFKRGWGNDTGNSYSKIGWYVIEVLEKTGSTYKILGQQAVWIY